MQHAYFMYSSWCFGCVFKIMDVKSHPSPRVMEEPTHQPGYRDFLWSKVSYEYTVRVSGE